MTDENRYLKQRQGRWHYIRRVPKRVGHLDGRGKIEISLTTNSLDVARLRRDAMEEADTLYWASLLGGGESAVDPATARYKAAQQRALALGFVWKSASDLLDHAPVDELLERLEALKSRPEAGLKADAEALLGTVPKPSVTVSKALEIFLTEIAPDELTGKSKAQRASYEKVKRRAVTNFIQVVGDKDLGEITRQDALAFYDWWQKRVTGEKGLKRLSGNSANRDVGNMRRLYTEYFRRLGEEARDNPFRNLSFRDPKALKQDVPPFPVTWLKDRFLSPGAFDGLNREAALLLLALIETGCRPSELCNITGDQIHLEAEVPFLEIRFREDRAIKTESSVRQIPLIGVSLEAMKRAPDGFPRYRDKETNFSAAAMKHLRRTGLLPSDNHRVYSLRHSFESRMKEAHLDYELRCLLMGHAITRPDYGDGGSLKYRQRELAKIELPFSLEVFDRLRRPEVRRKKV
ncbi:DUF6538 domain-containing protein [Roseibium polysiphoniae]|uniref:Integrase n=1 Tax=Roseibium polysiphoniae TaxID=2571221 RepID=A0ABR9C722_9HYPH|nr:integrase [Roseibium polysiphoniae]